MIKVSSLIIDETEEALVLEVLRSGRLAQGPMVERFEEAVRTVTRTAHAVAVSNGTDALMLALHALDLEPGDEVVLPAFTFVATLNAVLHSGATPRFVDVGDDRCLDPGALADAIGPRTRAVIPVHMYGLPADMEGVRRAIGERPIAIVEDSAQAIGARYGDRSAGSLGTMGCFSFYATKNITTGEGGAITTDDDDLAARLRTLRNQGQGARYDYEEPGFNARMTELQAAVGVAQMGRFDRIVEARRNNAAALTEGLRGIEGLTLPAEPPGRFHVYHHYAARVGLDARLTREKVVDALGEAGVEAGTHYPRAVYDYACFRADPRVGKVRLPQAETLAAEVVSLPVHPSLSEDDLAWIVRSVQAILA